MSFKKITLGSLLLLAALVTAYTLAEAKTGDRPKATTAQKAFLGVYLEDIDQDTQEALNLNSKEGVLVEGVVDDSPAEKAGLQEQDVIISLDGEKVKDSDQLKEAVAKHRPGEEVKVVVIRDGKKNSLEVKLGSSQEVENEIELSLPEPGDMKTFSFSFPGFNRARLGVQIMDLTKQLGEYFGVGDGKGALITEVMEDSPAEKAGLKAGDIIVKIDRDKIKSTSDVYEALEDKEKGDQVNVEVVRDHGRESLTVTVELEGAPEGHADTWKSMAPQFRKTVPPEIKLFTNHEPDQSELRAEMKELRKQLEELKKDLEEMKKEIR